MRAEILLIISILLLSGSITTSRGSQKNAEDLIQDICDKLFNENLDSDEDQQWETLCTNLFKYQQHHDISSENNIDELYMKKNHQPRRSGSRSGSRFRSGFRSGSGSRSGGSRGSGSRTSGGGGTSSFGTRYRSTRTGTYIYRPTGWLWSQSRYGFVPVSQHYYYRSRSSTNRYTTPATGSETYYYCSSNSSVSMEIQCSTINGDGQCCEDETTHEVFCCGGPISDDLVEDYSQATRILARLFYTLSAIALLMHIFIRRFHQ